MYKLSDMGYSLFGGWGCLMLGSVPGIRASQRSGPRNVAEVPPGGGGDEARESLGRRLKDMICKLLVQGPGAVLR